MSGPTEYSTRAPLAVKNSALMIRVKRGKKSTAALDEGSSYRRQVRGPERRAADRAPRVNHRRGGLDARPLRREGMNPSPTNLEQDRPHHIAPVLTRTVRSPSPTAVDVV